MVQQTNEALEIKPLVDSINTATKNVKEKLKKLQDNQDNGEMNIADMFNMQYTMNSLSQLTELITNFTATAHQATSQVARNLKG